MSKLQKSRTVCEKASFVRDLSCALTFAGAQAQNKTKTTKGQPAPAAEQNARLLTF
jgi:hypothetical protein